MKLNITLALGIAIATLALSARAGLNTSDCQTSSSYDCYSYNYGYCDFSVPTCDNNSYNTQNNCGGTPNVQTAVPEPSTWMAGALVALPLAGTFVRILRQRRSQIE